MRAFQYFVPTQIIFGPGTEQQVGQAVRQQGAQRVLVLYGGGSAVRSGLIDRVKASLDAVGVTSYFKGGVQANPLLSFASEAVAEYGDKDIDLVLAVGGGSVMDTAKGVAIGLTLGEEEMQAAYHGKVHFAPMKPVGAVVTIAASGSESSPVSVLAAEAADENGHEKLLCFAPGIAPRFAILNPELTYTTPPLQTACGIVDILMHTLERYCSGEDGNDMTDAIAEALLRNVVIQGRVCMKNPNDYHARSELMWCGTLSHNDITGLGQNVQMTVHQMGHELDARYNIPHAMSLTMLWSSWAETVWEREPGRFARLGRAVFGLTETDDAAAARGAIKAFTDYFQELGLPVNFSQSPVGVVAPEMLEVYTTHCTTGRGCETIGGLYALDYDGVLSVFRKANV